MTRLVGVCILGEWPPLCDLELCLNTCTLMCAPHTCTPHTCTPHTCTPHTCTPHTCTPHTCTPHTCTPSRHSHTHTHTHTHTNRTSHSTYSTDGAATPGVLPSTSLLRRLVNTFTPSKRVRPTLSTEGGVTRKAAATTPFRSSAASAQRRGAGSTGRRKRSFREEVCFPVAQWVFLMHTSSTS